MAEKLTGKKLRQLAQSIAIAGILSGGSAAFSQPVWATVTPSESLFLPIKERSKEAEPVNASSNAISHIASQPVAPLDPPLETPLDSLDIPLSPPLDTPLINNAEDRQMRPRVSPIAPWSPAVSNGAAPNPATNIEDSQVWRKFSQRSRLQATSSESTAHELGDRPRQSATLQHLISQNAPAGEQPNLEDNQPPLPLPEPPPVLPEEEPAPPQTTEPSQNGEVTINEIQVIGSSVFSEADLAPILSAYEGQSLGLRELRQAADDITQLYLESGYITSRAVLGEQTIVDGIVQVRVVEGELEDIQVEGTDRLAGYVRDRVNLANRKPLSQVALESQLQLLRADPLIEQVEASLRAGTGEGQSRLIVRVLEAPAFSGRAVLDTNSPPSVGVVRMGLETNYANLLGFGDQFSATAYRSTAGGSHSYGLSYTLPLNAMNGTLQARYLPSSFRLIDPALASLNVRGSSQTYELTYRQPLIRQPNEEFALSLGFRHRTGETLVSNVVIDSTRTSVLQFGQDYLRRDRSGAWGLRSQFNIGTGLFDATNRANGLADGQFFSWSGQVQRAQVINRDNLLLMQASVQFSADSLLGADQFIVGGPSSVRGYSQNARFGDNGFRASIEDRITISHNDNGSPAVQIVPFLDMAGVWNQQANTNNQRFLLGTGVGMIANPVENVQARVDVGVPLVQLNEAGDSDQGAFIYFNIDYRF